jgi:3-methyladenine DNA glycosylase AlkD
MYRVVLTLLFFLRRKIVPTKSIIIKEVKAEIRSLENPSKAKFLQRFFKTGKGEYAEGDIFLGITVPVSRSIAKKFSGLSIDDSFSLLKSKFHEERLIALFIITRHFEKSTMELKKEIIDKYLAHTKYINNWDLVDSSAYKIFGKYLLNKPKDILLELAKSSMLWERRIAMVSTYAFIKEKETSPTFQLALLLMNDNEDLMHKAVGWMLREAGKPDPVGLDIFLTENYKKMPRTMLRYAIEKFPEKKRKAFLTGKIESD